MEKIRQVEIVSRYPKALVPKDEYVAFTLDVMEKLDLSGTVVIYFCGRDRIRELNRKFRGKNYPTDVLSFPCSEEEEGMVHVGDVAICIDVAKHHAKEYGVDIGSEVRKLIVHSVLHLCGYDHESDRGQMLRKERSLLKALGVPA